MDLLWISLKEFSIPFQYEIYQGIQRISIGPFHKRDAEYKQHHKMISKLCHKKYKMVAMETALDPAYVGGIFHHYDSYIWIFNVPIQEFKKRGLATKLNDAIGTIDGEDEIEEEDWDFLRTSKIEDPHSLFEMIQKNKEMYQQHIIPEIIEKAWHPSRFEKWCL